MGIAAASHITICLAHPHRDDAQHDDDAERRFRAIVPRRPLGRVPNPETVTVRV